MLGCDQELMVKLEGRWRCGMACPGCSNDSWLGVYMVCITVPPRVDGGNDQNEQV